MKRKQALVPDYYQEFHCIGGECEESCCIGWKISVDEVSLRRYQACQHEVLTPMFREALIENQDAQTRTKENAAAMKCSEDGRCSFLQADNLCSIHRHLGGETLSDTCATYPRYVNLFGGQLEYSLGISCPEAARKVLLHPEPIGFELIAVDPDLERRGFISRRFPQQSNGDPAQMAILNDLRGLVIGLLQFRELSLGARLMVLGFLLEDVDKVTSSAKFKQASELLPVLQGYSHFVSNPANVEAQFAQINGDLARKIQTIGNVLVQFLAERATPRMRECLIAASSGLLAGETEKPVADADLLGRYSAAYRQYYAPYFQDKGYILENYLVNQVLTRLFPFAIGNYLDLYRELVCNLAIVQVLLVGMAAHEQGLSDERVVQLLQSFARKTNHNPAYLEKLLLAIGATGQGKFVDVMWLLKEA
ncbi:flagellin lysine-N-methylase [Ferriphaselus sp. R-1]|uniref:flagellin lysine-N-methylase n=1 Tax=Ferriphaselus sp. R-1 TaxID=1485544 RepID=UPI0005580D47|nr:flagellin lysine-N-methylase [Ferriphaselus sp. R-1]